MKLEQIEQRFKEVSNLECNLALYPLDQVNHLQVKTNKEKSDSFGEVFTPLWLVDKMLELPPIESFMEANTTLDLCSGYGQFTIRWMRKLETHFNYLGPSLDLDKFFATHWVSELQRESCYKLLYIFGNRLNLAIGDARHLPSLSDNAKGVWMHDGLKWVNVTIKTHKLLDSIPTDNFTEFNYEISRRIK